MLNKALDTFNEFRPALFDGQAEFAADIENDNVEPQYDRPTLYTADEVIIFRQESFDAGSNAEKFSSNSLRHENSKRVWQNLLNIINESITTQEATLHSACEAISRVIFETLFALLPSMSDRMVRREISNAVHTLLASASTETALTIRVSPLLRAEILEVLDQLPSETFEKLVLIPSDSVSDEEVIFEWVGGIANYSPARIRTFIEDILEDMTLLKAT